MAKKSVKKKTAKPASKKPVKKISKTISAKADSSIVTKPNPSKGGLNCKSWNDACAFYGYSPKNLPVVTMLPKPMQEYLVNHYQTVITIGAINKDVKPNWADGSTKYEIWAWVQTKKDGKTNPSGFGFARTSYADTGTRTYVGARLGFRGLAERAHYLKHFEKQYTVNQLYIAAKELNYKLPG